jgi:succinate dehydrogenase/fumarate reductase flavoprotein subunit
VDVRGDFLVIGSGIAGLRAALRREDSRGRTFARTFPIATT